MERLNPVLMTALSAGLARIPLALAGAEPGNEIQSRMALVVLGGLLTALCSTCSSCPRCSLRYGVDRPGTAGAATPRRGPEPVLEGVR